MKQFSQIDQPSKSRPFQIGRALVILLGVAGIAIFAPRFRGKNHSPLNILERKLRDELPIGSTKEELRLWASHRNWSISFREYDLATLPSPPAKTLPEISGIPREELKSFAEMVIDWGSFKLWSTGEIADNKLWIFVSLDENGRVLNHYFLTLEGLAEYERQRDVNRE